MLGPVGRPQSRYTNQAGIEKHHVDVSHLAAWSVPDRGPRLSVTPRVHSGCRLIPRPGQSLVDHVDLALTLWPETPRMTERRYS